MKLLKLFCLALVMIFLVVGCKKKELEPMQQAEVEVEEKPTQPSEPAKQTESAKLISTETIHQASEKGDVGHVQLRISEGTDINSRDDRGSTALHYAAKNGHKDVAQLLITNGADVNAKGPTDGRPLHFASAFGQKDMVEFLVTNGANVNVKDLRGRTPLAVAEMRQHTEVIELLRKHGAKE